uniref:Uncharacterized protein n=1 Tax=Arundo donax TaxID=35708 RepID=A0A0A9HB99_ARUDO
MQGRFTSTRMSSRRAEAAATRSENLKNVTSTNRYSVLPSKVNFATIFSD